MKPAVCIRSKQAKKTKDHDNRLLERQPKTKMLSSCRKAGCDKVFVKSCNRDRHEAESCKFSGKVVIKTKQKPKCPQCGKEFAKPYGLKRHQQFSCKAKMSCDDSDEEVDLRSVKDAVGDSPEDMVPGSPESDADLILEGLLCCFYNQK
jgi:hypothetical protein